MQLRRKRYLAIPFLVLTWSVMPILGLQSSSRNILSEGTVTYPERQLGVWEVRRALSVPDETRWISAYSPDYGKSNLLENPGFEFNVQGWRLFTPPAQTPLHVDILPGYIGNSAFMVSDEFGYRGGLNQAWDKVPPNTTIRYSAMIKTIDVESLEIRALFWDISVGGQWVESGEAEMFQGSRDWTLYEAVFTTPDELATVAVTPALVYNRGEVRIDEVYVNMEPGEPKDIPVVLDWSRLHRPFDPFNPFKTEADLKYVEKWYKTLSAGNFWGILFIGQEHYRIHVEFNDDVNTTWFDENLLGYPLYLAESPSKTVDDWKDEMYLRMIRGFYNYFSPLTKVGITVPGGSIVEFWKDQGWSGGIPYCFGEPALDFISENLDFVILYAYTEKLEDFTNWTSQYFQLIDQLFQKQKKLWILTRIWDENRARWQPEAMALELKNCFDRNIPVLNYHEWTEPPLEEVWPLMLKAIELYDSKAPYYENRVNGRNLLTGYVGDTYGYVEVLG